MFTTVHMRNDPDTMAQGTDPLGPYGSGFCLMALVLDIFVYLPLLLMAVYGVCTRKAKYDNTPSDKVENEEANVKAE